MSTITQDHQQPIGNQTKEKIDTTTAQLSGHWNSLTVNMRTTIAYASIAAASLMITGLIELANRPASIKEYGKVGQPFFPAFSDPTTATSLSLAAIDADKAVAQEFSVEKQKNGQWVIPSHHNYPADAEDQLAETAASVIGIRRGAMVTRWKSDHARYGVVNPKVDSLSADEVEGVGQRLTLRGADESILADYIIGKKVDDASDQYYVRHPDEDETYIATLDIDLSTKFNDWIDTDLLGIDSWDVRHVSLNDYKFDELKGTVTQREVTNLARDSSSADWQMDNIDEKVADIDKDAVRQTVNAISGLAIVGVRPKQTGLTPELRLDRSALQRQADVDRLQSDLLSRGFLLQPSEEGDKENLKLIAREGELSTATEDGIVYNMYFGRVFTGDQDELETGFTSTKKKAESSEEKTVVTTTEDTNPNDKEAQDFESKPADTEDSAEQDSGKPGRYVFVTARFDKRFLGEEPEQPVEPEMPEELKAVESETEVSDESGKTDADESTGDEESESEADSDIDVDKDDQEAKRLEELREEYEVAKEDYDADLEEYEAYQQRVEEGKQKAEELNRRFARWYYVIDGDDYDKLALTKTDLIKAKEQDSDNAENSDGSEANETQKLPDATEAEPSSEEKTESEGSAEVKELESEQVGVKNTIEDQSENSDVNSDSSLEATSSPGADASKLSEQSVSELDGDSDVRGAKETSDEDSAK